MNAPPLSGNKEPALVALLNELAQLEAALAELQAARFTKEQIGFLCRVVRGVVDTMKHSEDSAVNGAGVIEHASWGISAGALPSVGRVVAGGTLNGVVTSAVLEAAPRGIVDAFISVGLGDDDARRYVDHLIGGKMVLVVYGGERAGWVQSVLRNHGAFEIQSTFAAREGDRS